MTIIIYITYLFGLLNLIGNKWQLIPLISAVNVGLIDNGKKLILYNITNVNFYHSMTFDLNKRMEISLLKFIGIGNFNKWIYYNQWNKRLRKWKVRWNGKILMLTMYVR